MGTVYLASVERPVLGLEPGANVALKVLHRSFQAQRTFAKRFAKEAEHGGKIVHPNVVQTYGPVTLDCEDGPWLAIAMEWVEGQTLRELMVRAERHPEPLCRQIALEVAKGLSAIHAGGITHRDIKPENLIVTAANVVKVMDLGLARPTEAALQLSSAPLFVGSPLYAAPEQFSEDVGTQVDARADLYALGVCLYELTTGVHPYAHPKLNVVVERLRKGERLSPRSRNAALSPYFDRLITKLTHSDRDERVGSAAELVDILQQGERSEWWRRIAGPAQADSKRARRLARVTPGVGLYGRKTQLDELEAAFEMAAQGEGRVCVLEGEEGCGKSRLVDEFLDGLHNRRREHHALVGAYRPDGVVARVSGFAEALADYFSSWRLEEGLTSHMPNRLGEVAAFAAHLRGVEPPLGVGSVSPSQAVPLYGEVLQSLAAHRPTVVVVDDLHRASPEGLSTFKTLAYAAPTMRLLLIGTTSPRGLSADVTATLAKLPELQYIEVGRLGPRDLVSLLTDALGSLTLAEELTPKVGVQSDGNPYIALESVRELQRTKQLQRSSDGAWHCTSAIDDMVVPSTVRSLVLGRLGVLDRQARELMEAASCFGFQFDPEVIGEVIEQSDYATLQRLAAVQASTNLVRHTDREYVFDQHHVHEALYSSIAPQLRQLYHGRIADALIKRSRQPVEPALAARICTQLVRAGRTSLTRPYLHGAFKHLEATHATDAELALLEAVLAAPRVLEGALRFEHLLRRATLLEWRGLLLEQRKVLEQALQIADAQPAPRRRPASPLAEEQAIGDPSPRPRAAGPDVFISYSSKDKVVARKVVRTLEASDLTCWIAERDNRPGVDYADGIEKAIRKARAVVLLYSANAARSADVLREVKCATDVGREVIPIRIQAAKLAGNFRYFLGSRHWVDAWGRKFARSMAEVATQVKGLLPHRRTRRRGGSPNPSGGGDSEGDARSMGARVRARLGWAYYLGSDALSASRILTEAVALAEQVGDPKLVTEAKGNLGIVLVQLGQYAEADRLLKDALRFYRESGDEAGQARALSASGLALKSQGRAEESAAPLREALTLFRSLGDQKNVASAHGNVGVLEFRAGRWESAQQHFEEQLTASRALGSRRGEAIALLNLGPLHSLLGRLSRGMETLQTARRLCLEISWREGEAHAAHLSGVVNLWRGDPQKAYTCHAEAVALRRSLSDWSSLKESLAHQGAAAVQSRQLDVAKLLFAEVLDGHRLVPGASVVALSWSLRLPGVDPVATLEQLDALWKLVALHERLAGRFAVWEVVRTDELLHEVRRDLELLLSGAPVDAREPMCREVDLLRRVARSL